jgi:hypothetical protein
MNNWKLILEAVLTGPKTSTELRKMLFEARNPDRVWDARKNRGTYAWYFTSHPYFPKWPGCGKNGLDYGYIQRVERKGQPCIYVITTKGHTYLTS